MAKHDAKVLKAVSTIPTDIVFDDEEIKGSSEVTWFVSLIQDDNSVAMSYTIDSVTVKAGDFVRRIKIESDPIVEAAEPSREPDLEIIIDSLMVYMEDERTPDQLVFVAKLGSDWYTLTYDV